MRRLVIAVLILTAQAAHADGTRRWSIRAAQHLGHQPGAGPYVMEESTVGAMPLGLEMETRRFRVGVTVPLSWTYEAVPTDEQGQEGPYHRLVGGLGGLSAHLEVSHPVTPWLRVSAFTMLAVAPGGENQGVSHAARAFFYDPAITWPESHTAYLQVATHVQRPDSSWSVDVGVGQLLYWGGRFGHTQSVTRIDAGPSWRLPGDAHCWTLSGRFVMVTDALDEGVDEGYDAVSALQVAAVRTVEQWQYGAYIAENFGAGSEPMRTTLGLESRWWF